MRTVRAFNNFICLRDDGSIHYPYSQYLTSRFTNPNTLALVSLSLRIFDRFCIANEIELPARALDGKCLTFLEIDQLARLCYRPFSEIEALSSKKIILLTSAKAKIEPSKFLGAVQPNTALRRLKDIGEYLNHYLEVFLEPNVRQESKVREIRIAYAKSIAQAKNKIGGTKQNHHHQIQSLPNDKFMELIECFVKRPNELFINESGNLCRAILRDRAMTLLACEGLRPGTIANIAISDFRPESGRLCIIDNRDKRKKQTAGTPVLKLGASTLVNSASETMISLWPFTIRAIQEYISSERNAIQSKNLKNKSLGFLFLTNGGGPIKNRGTMTTMFKVLGNRLNKLGLLQVENDPYFKNKARYEFYGYVLRHSAACFYLAANGTSDKTLDSMKSRFGWTISSQMPQIYAARTLSDLSNTVMNKFTESLMSDALIN